MKHILKKVNKHTWAFAFISGIILLNFAKAQFTVNNISWLTNTTSSADLTVNGLTVGRGANGTANGLIANCTALGINALATSSAQDGGNNTAIGWSALRYNTKGYSNVAVGLEALSGTSTISNLGVGNVAVGNSALRLNRGGGTRGS